MPRVQVGDVQLYCESEGSGPPLLLISGTAWSGEFWKLEQVPFLARHFRVVIFDHRGTGRSDRPEGPYSMQLFAADAIGVLDALGIREPAHVLGHSMGGRVAQWICLQRPERVRSLVLAGSGPGQIDPTQPYARGVPLATAEGLARLGWPGYFEDHLRSRMLFLDPPAGMVDRFVAAFRPPCDVDLHSYLLHTVARQQHQVTDRLGEITVQTLVIDGAEDTVVGGGISHVESSRYLAEHLPHADPLVLIPGAAHAFMVEKAEETNQAVLRFLQAH